MHVPEVALKNCQCFASSLFSNHCLTGEQPLHLCREGGGEREERSFRRKIYALTKGLHPRVIGFSKFAAAIN